MVISTTTDVETLRARIGAQVAERMRGHVERLRWDADRLAAHQCERLRALLRHALAHSPFHARRLGGLDPDRVELADLAGLPTMFPFLMHVSQGSLSPDDIAWISRLYPAPGAAGFAATHGTIRGIVYFSDGESHVQFANVIARRVGDERSIAVSNVAPPHASSEKSPLASRAVAGAMRTMS